MEHARRVLGMIDIHLYETHGMIADWEAGMRAEMGAWWVGERNAIGLFHFISCFRAKRPERT
jgi:hypothetical protein